MAMAIIAAGKPAKRDAIVMYLTRELKSAGSMQRVYCLKAMVHISFTQVSVTPPAKPWS